jgi:hypothetical protein
MDRNEIDDAVHEISMMVAVLLDAQENMQAAPDTNPSVFQMPRAAGEMVPLPRLTSINGLRPYGMRWTGRPRLSSGSGATNAPDPALCGACLLSGEHLAGNGREVARWLLTAL